jgi:hypothetical protein
MHDHPPPQIDMRLDGSFQTPPRPSFLTQVFAWGVGIAIIAAGLAVAAFALWLALILVPVALIAGLIAWGAFRFQLWRARNASPHSRDIWRP